MQRTSFLNQKVKTPLVRGRNTPDARYPLKSFQNN
jgi:hypothetical protein